MGHINTVFPAIKNEITEALHIEAITIIKDNETLMAAITSAGDVRFFIGEDHNKAFERNDIPALAEMIYTALDMLWRTVSDKSEIHRGINHIHDLLKKERVFHTALQYNKNIDADMTLYKYEQIPSVYKIDIRTYKKHIRVVTNEPNFSTEISNISWFKDSSDETAILHATNYFEYLFDCSYANEWKPIKQDISEIRENLYKSKSENPNIQEFWEIVAHDKQIQVDFQTETKSLYLVIPTSDIWDTMEYHGFNHTCMEITVNGDLTWIPAGAFIHKEDNSPKPTDQELWDKRPIYVNTYKSKL